MLVRTLPVAPGARTISKFSSMTTWNEYFNIVIKHSSPASSTSIFSQFISSLQSCWRMNDNGRLASCTIILIPGSPVDACYDVIVILLTRNLPIDGITIILHCRRYMVINYYLDAIMLRRFMNVILLMSIVAFLRCRRWLLEFVCGFFVWGRGWLW